MIRKRFFALVVSIVTICACGRASAYESGFPLTIQKPGVTLGGDTALAPPPGVYMFNQFFDYQAKFAGPGAPTVNGNPTSNRVNNATVGVLYVPGWTVLGAQYAILVVQPINFVSVGAPLNIAPGGLHNTLIAPADLSWKLGESGFFAKARLAVYVPDGDIRGASGLASIGNPWYTIQPEFIVSYAKNNWGATLNVFEEFHTANMDTGYRTGDILHAEFCLTRTFGKLTIGPAGYYLGQVSNDRSSGFYGGAINANRYNIVAVGGLAAYDFGPVIGQIVGVDEVLSHASGGTLTPAGTDSASSVRGFTVLTQFSYKIH